MLRGRLIERQPERDPGESDHAGEHERELPAVRQDRPGDERRREHGAERRAHVEEAAGEPRSAAGNHSDVAFIPAGFADPSANPSSARRPKSVCQLAARPCAMLMNDQAIAKIANPSFSPTLSIT